MDEKGRFNYKYDTELVELTEVEKEILFPVEELGLPDTYKKPWGNKRHKIWVYKYDGEVIWGITSVIIKDVIEKY